MRGRPVAILAMLATACAACEAIVGITDRQASSGVDGGPDGGQVTPPSPEAGDATEPAETSDSPEAADGAEAGAGQVPDAAEGGQGFACAKGGCNAVGGACTGAGTCHCTTDTDCPGTKCVAVSGQNDVACGSACTGSGATDGFGCQLAGCVTTRFGYRPSNFTPALYAPPTMPTTDCNGTYSSTTHAFSSGGCSGQAPVIVRNVAQAGGGHAVDILVFQDLTVASTSTLLLVGANPVILAVYGDATIHGTVDASASGSTPGAGANECAVASNGADAGTGSWEPGGGGGGQASAGGTGGPSMGVSGEIAGNAQGTSAVPLSGGCAGGQPFVGSLGYAPAAGAGGGGVQVSAAGHLDLTGGSVKANGSGGGPGEAGRCNGIAQNGTGGGGGGSGGTLVLEGATVVMGTTSVSGGAGGTGGPAPSPNSQIGGDGGAGGAPGAGGAAGSPGVEKGAAPSGCTWGGFWSGGGGGGGAGGYFKTNQGGGACACTADSACASGLCSNVGSQCTGTCSGTTGAGTYDAIDCQILKAASQ